MSQTDQDKQAAADAAAKAAADAAAEKAENDGDAQHLSDAEKFFNENPQDDTIVVDDPDAAAKAEADKAAADKAAAEKKAADEKTVDPLEGVFKTEKKVEKTPETDDVDADLDALDAPKGDEAKAGWTKLKGIASEARKQVATLTQQLEQAKIVDPKSKEIVDDRVKELEAQNQVFSDRLKALDLVNHPDFQKEHVVPQQQILAAIKLTVEGVEGAEDIEGILGLGQRDFAKKISELGEGLDEFTKTQLYSAARDFRTVRTRATQALENRDQSLQGYQASSEQHAKAVFEKVSASMVNGQNFVAQVIPDDAPEELVSSLNGYNEAFAGIKQAAENMAFGDNDETSVASMAHKAALYDFSVKHGLPRVNQVIAEQINVRDARIQELEAKVKGISNAKPGHDYGADDDGDETKKVEEMDSDAASKLIDFN